jgi:hypothetical protein
MCEERDELEAAVARMVGPSTRPWCYDRDRPDSQNRPASQDRPGELVRELKRACPRARLNGPADQPPTRPPTSVREQPDEPADEHSLRLGSHGSGDLDRGGRADPGRA